MKNKKIYTIILITLFFGATILPTTIGLKTSNPNNQTDANTQSDKTINIGTIMITNYGANDHNIEVTTNGNPRTEDLGVDGGELTVQVTVKMYTPGRCDHAYAQLIRQNDIKAEVDHGEDCWYNTTLTYTEWGSPYENMYFTLKGRYTDWFGEDWSREKEVHIKIKEYSQPDMAVSEDYFEYNNQKTAGKKYTPKFNIMNTGDGSFTYTIEPGANEYTMDISPLSGTVGPRESKEVTITINAPSYLKSKRQYSWWAYIYASTGDKESILIYVNTADRPKAMMRPIFYDLASNFPLLAKILSL
jgi:hypothetical protein